MAASLMKKMAKTAVTAKVAGFNKATLKNVVATTKTSTKNRLEVTATQVNFSSMNFIQGSLKNVIVSQSLAR
jgi:hypothetical protein